MFTWNLNVEITNDHLQIMLLNYLVRAAYRLPRTLDDGFIVIKYVKKHQ